MEILSLTLLIGVAVLNGIYVLTKSKPEPVVVLVAIVLLLTAAIACGRIVWLTAPTENTMKVKEVIKELVE